MTLEQASDYFKLIADPNRLVVLKLLTTNLHMCGCDFLKHVNCKQSTLSHHLSEMTNAGLLNAKKSGNKTIYSINAPKYEQLVNYLSKLDRTKKTISKNNEVIKPLEKSVNQADSTQKKKEKKDLPTFLL